MRSILLLSILALAACDQATNAPANQPPTTSVRSHSWQLCTSGEGRFERRGENDDWQPFEWDAILLTSAHDSIVIRQDTTVCRNIGTFSDTTRFKFMGRGDIGTETTVWFRMDGDSLPYKWSSTFHADSLRAVRWED